MQRAKVGVFFQHTIGFARTGAPADDAALRVRRLGIDARALQRLAVEGCKVPGLVDGDNRHAGRDGIQLITRGVAALGQLRIIVAKAKGDLQLLHLGRCSDVAAQGCLQRGNIGIRPIWRWQQIGRDGLQPHAAQVAVRVHKTRQQSTPLQIHHLGGRALPACYFGTGAHGHNAPGTHGHGLHLGLCIVHGQDGAAPVNHICHTGTGRRPCASGCCAPWQTDQRQPCRRQGCAP